MVTELCADKWNAITPSKVLLSKQHVYHPCVDSLNNLDTKRQVQQFIDVLLAAA